MANRPSQRTNRLKPIDGLNLTPFIDMVTCLMFFLLMFAGIIPIVIVDAPLPKIASSAEEVKQAKDDKNKLDLTLYISPNGITVKSTLLGSKTFPKTSPDEPMPLKELHSYLVQVKAKKPEEKEITLMPSDDTNYDLMVQVMDAARTLEAQDPGYQTIPPEISGKPESEEFNRLFSDVSIGGV